MASKGGNSTLTAGGRIAPEDTDPLAIALQGLSLEIGVHDLEALERHRDRLPAGGRIYINAVAGEGGEARLQVAARLAAMGYQPVPHIAARRIPSADALSQYLAGFVERANIREILVIGGDLREPLGPYKSALDVIHSGLPVQHGIERIGFAGYPDGHPHIDSAILQQALEDKFDACKTANIDPYIVTQFSFRARAIIAWCHSLHARHPDLPVHAGIPGPAKLGTLIRFARVCGVRTSMKKLASNRKMSIDLLRRTAPWDQMEAIGRYRTDSGRPISAHLFTFGGLNEMAKWLQQVENGRRE